MISTAIKNASAEGSNRRSFLQGILSAGGLLLAARVPGMAAVPAGELPGALADFSPNVWLSIDGEGKVTIVAHRSEMGTGIRTSLPMVVAEELGADWQSVHLEQALGDAKYGSQNTDGSRSIRRFYSVMRDAGASARAMLEQAAAARWGVGAKDCDTRGGKVLHASSDREIGFGELVDDAAKLSVPTADSLRYRKPEERRYVGKETKIYDLEGILDGSAIFGMDARLPGTKHAAVARCPVVGGKVKSFDSKAAEAIPGVEKVVQIPAYRGHYAFQPLGGIAVIAKDTWSAMQGVNALEIEWDPGPNADYDSVDYGKALVAATHEPGQVFREVGDMGPAFEDGAMELSADYEAPHLAHAPMEPPCALAYFKDGAVEAWAPTQNPQSTNEVLMQVLGLPADKVKVNVTLLGGGFGRKSKSDFVAEAAFLSREVEAPVHVTWSREDDIRHDFYHTVTAVHMKAALNEEGKPTAMLTRASFPPINSTFDPSADGPSSFEMGMGLTDQPWAIPNIRVEGCKAKAKARIGWLRSVSHIPHAFAVNSFVDELAHAMDEDPYQYLMELMGEDRMLDLTGVEYPNHGEPMSRYPFDVGRLKAVTKIAAERAGWGRELPRGKGLGISCHRSFLSYQATVVEVDVSKRGRVSIPKVWSVIDCGLAVNPDRVRSQLEGAAVFGASLTLSGAVTMRNGAVQQSNFHDHPIARINEAPREVDAHIVPSEALPGGVGEVGVPPFSAALCNAIFAATGKRVRKLPLSGQDLRWS
ncbi:MAG: xanthine dehydrogenase family protein molybdopterin-binding subunit [Planctomycetota bacterium]|jgi:isoquinoline 1-oxidoreductase beta subunit